jgi:CRISPR-associated protein Csb2
VSYLVFNARFLREVYLGAAKGEVWPPDPLRVFYSCVSTAHLIWGRPLPKSVSDALKWFESLPAPTIHAPLAKPLSSYEEARPILDTGFLSLENGSVVVGGSNPTLDTVTRHFVGDDTQISYVWGLPTSDLAHLPIVLQCLSQIPYLGRSEDVIVSHAMVSDTDPSGLPGLVWNAYPTKDRRSYRVPREGTFDDSESVYQQRAENNQASVFTRDFNAVQYCVESGTNMQEMYLFHICPETGVGFKHYPQRETVVVAAWVRGQANLIAENLVDDNIIRTYLNGHGQTKSERDLALSYIPLPTLGRSDGKIRRVLVVIPFGAPPEVLTVVESLDTVKLTNTAGDTKGYLRKTPIDQVTRSYLSSSREWVSVTPIVTKSHLTEKTAASVLSKIVQHAGIKSPVVGGSWQLLPYCRQSNFSRDYKVPSCHTGRYLYHVSLTFQAPVKGPLVLGDGRKSGLGLMLPASG